MEQGNIKKNIISNLKKGDVFEYKRELDKNTYYYILVEDDELINTSDVFKFAGVNLVNGELNLFSEEANIVYRPDIIFTSK